MVADDLNEPAQSRRRHGGALLLLGAIGPVAAVLIVLFVPVGPWLIEALERRFPPLPLPERIDGIVAISGEWFGERTVPLVNLSKHYPNAIVLYSGMAEHQNPLARFTQFGGDASRLRVEARSENTYENAQFSAVVVKPEPNQTWLLITSAYHMPRAVGCFRRAGFRVRPYSVEFRNPQGGYGFAQHQANWSDFKFALREWGALVSYWLLGRTDALVPGPQGED